MSTPSAKSDPPQRQRKVHAKTRTGCKTCKIRKVKCDEAKPYCKRCTSTGRKCDGYPSLEQPVQTLHSRSSSPLSSALILPPHLFNSTIPGSTGEKRGFQYFVTNTAAELSGYFNEEFWRGFVVKACWERDNATLRHAVVGLGALHEAFENSEEGSIADDGFAIAQYSKAITHLREILSSTRTSDSPLTALISCVLFVCFDSLRGAFASAMVHLQSGLRILNDARAQIKAQTLSNSRRQGKGISKEEEFIMEKYIAPLFVRLSVQAILYVDTRTVEEKLAMAKALTSVKDKDTGSEEQEMVFDKPVFDEQEWKFETLEEAREKLNFAADGLFRMFWICDGNLPISEQPVNIVELTKTHAATAARWTTSFAKFMSQSTTSFTTNQVRAATLLKIHQCILQVMLSSIPSPSDTRSMAEVMNAASTFSDPASVSNFSTTVTLCRSFVAAVEQDALKAPGSVSVARTGKIFSTDLGIVGPLYYVGTKCTVPSIRSEALALLNRWRGREGMWDSSMGGKLVREFWEMEKRFGNRGYDVVENAGPRSSNRKLDVSAIIDAAQDKWDQAVGGTNRGRVSLVVGEGRKWEWKVQLDDDTNITVPHVSPGLSPSGSPDQMDGNHSSTPSPYAPGIPSSTSDNYNGLFTDFNLDIDTLFGEPWGDLFDASTLPPPPVEYPLPDLVSTFPNSELEVDLDMAFPLPVEQPPAPDVNEWLRHFLNLEPRDTVLGFDMGLPSRGFGISRDSTPRSYYGTSSSGDWSGSSEGRSSC